MVKILTETDGFPQERLAPYKAQVIALETVEES